MVPTGEVTILDGRMVIATITLTAADDGRTTVTLPAFARGIRPVMAKFGGNDQLTPSTSRPAPIIAYSATVRTSAGDRRQLRTRPVVSAAAGRLAR